MDDYEQNFIYEKIKNMTDEEFEEYLKECREWDDERKREQKKKSQQ